MTENHESTDLGYTAINQALTYQWAQENYHELNLTNEDLDTLTNKILGENPQGVSIDGMQTELANKLEPRALALIFHSAQVIYPEFNLTIEYLESLVNKIKTENTEKLSVDEIAIKLKSELDKRAGAFAEKDDKARKNEARTLSFSELVLENANKKYPNLNLTLEEYNQHIAEIVTLHPEGIPRDELEAELDKKLSALAADKRWPTRNTPPFGGRSN